MSGCRTPSHDDAARMESVVEALRSKRHISGLTHQYYRYPAAFSPDFVRHAIDEYTSPGDVVLDPFVGGGTSVAPKDVLILQLR